MSISLGPAVSADSLVEKKSCPSSPGALDKVLFHSYLHQRPRFLQPGSCFFQLNKPRRQKETASKKSGINFCYPNMKVTLCSLCHILLARLKLFNASYLLWKTESRGYE